MAVLIIVVAMSVLAVNFYHCQVLDCNDLPKLLVPSIEVLYENGPYKVDYTLNFLFDCATQYFNKQAGGVTENSGSFFNFKGLNGLVYYDYVVDSDGVTMNGTICGTGVKSVWYVAAAEFGSSGAYYCLYSCNGRALAEFVCGSNNNGASLNELETFTQAGNVSNGFLIHDAKRFCPLIRNGCGVF